MAVHATRWHFQRPGGSWQCGTVPEARVNEFFMVRGHGRWMSVAYYGDRLTVRLLTLSGVASPRSTRG